MSDVLVYMQIGALSIIILKDNLFTQLSSGQSIHANEAGVIHYLNLPWWLRYRNVIVQNMFWKHYIYMPGLVLNFNSMT